MMKDSVMPTQQRADETAVREREEAEKLAQQLGRIRRKLVVLSGKGGVGKSTVAANLAVSLARRNLRTGLLDVDIHGPSIPRLLGLGGRRIVTSADGMMIPITWADTLKVISIGFLLRGDDDAVIWRGPLKMGVIRQFLSDVEWGELDYLVIDAPPGTGDEPLSVAQLVGQVDGAVIVTTPQDVAIEDVRRCVTFCRKVGMPVAGIVENMSSFVCPHCGKETAIFKKGGGEALARQASVRFLGTIPIDPAVTEASDDGRPYVRHHPRTATGRAFEEVIEGVLSFVEEVRPVVSGSQQVEEMSFGHCERFALVDVDRASGEAGPVELVDAPSHYVSGTLAPGSNVCDH